MHFKLRLLPDYSLKMCKIETKPNKNAKEIGLGKTSTWLGLVHYHGLDLNIYVC